MAFEHYDKCSLLLPMDGANNGTTFTDWSPNPKTVTVAGNAKTSTAQSQYYGSSGYFDGSGDYLTVPNSSGVFDATSTDWTIMCWLNTSSTDATNIKVIGTTRSNTNPPVGGYNFAINAGSTTHTIGFLVWDSSATVLLNLTSSTSITNNTWAHVAVVKIGNSVTVYINGSSVASGTVVGTPAIGQGTMHIGRDPTNTSRDWNGYIQDLLIIKGAALWTSNFTPPARLIGTISGEVRDKDNTPASRIVTAFPRTVPTKLYQTTSSAVDGTFSLRLPATESTALVMANEGVMRNDIVDRIIPE